MFIYVCLPDSSQSESLSDVEDHKPSFSRPGDSQNAEGSDASYDPSSNFSMYNTVSQKLMVKSAPPVIFNHLVSLLNAY